jgi:hypothetical protein
LLISYNLGKEIKKDGENCTMRNSINLHAACCTNKCWGDEITGGGVGWALSMHGRYEEFLPNFSRKNYRKRTTWKIRHKWKDIRMVLRVNGM